MQSHYSISTVKMLLQSVLSLQGVNLRNRTCIPDETNIQEKRNLIIIKQVVKYFFHKVKFLLHFIFFSVRTNLNNWRSSWLGWTCYFCATNNNNTLRLCLSNLFAVFKSGRVYKYYSQSLFIFLFFLSYYPGQVSDID